MMKVFNLLILLSIIFVSDYALAQIPDCPCDTLQLMDGTTGDNIVEQLCPDGELINDAFFVFRSDAVVIATEPLGYGVESFADQGDFCLIASGDDIESLKLTSDEYANCRQRLIQGCSLILNRPIPTLSEWGMIAMAGVFGIFGLILARRRKVVA